MIKVRAVAVFPFLIISLFISTSFGALMIPSLMNNGHGVFNISYPLETNSTIKSISTISNSEQANCIPNNIFEGDIIPHYESIARHYGKDLAEKMCLVPSQTSRGSSPSYATWRSQWSDYWDMPKMNFYISSNFLSAEKSIIYNSIRKLRNKSGVFWAQFLNERPIDGRPYISINENIYGGCGSSFVGFYESLARRPQGQPMFISRDDGCVAERVVQHELLHVMGFYHEHSRPDRDDYITIKWDNIGQGFDHNFNKANVNVINSLGTQYDYYSVMHYDAEAFSKNSIIKTVDAGDKTNIIGKNSKASKTDIIQVRLLYQCRDGIRTKSQYAKTRCTENCKCGIGFGRCRGNDNLCKGPLICRKNKCVWP